MITSFYAPLACVIVWLSLRVIKLRRAHTVRLRGGGGVPELEVAIRAQGNATEYIPVSLVLLALLELGVGPAIPVHTAGIALLIARLLRARGLITNHLPLLILAMQVTIYTRIGLALASLGYAVQIGVRAFFQEGVAWMGGRCISSMRLSGTSDVRSFGLGERRDRRTWINWPRRHGAVRLHAAIDQREPNFLDVG